MQYILIGFTDGTQGYQVIQDGTVINFVDEAGVTRFDEAPAGLGSWVIDAKPPVKDWMV